ncbi:hypothetical protein [Thermocatellispora tengchongensis]|uniref:hypothetical protein n=1 Tax=Thermocatellispora tengchongensis TaxID=1073253 RepID=UPI00362A63AA
MDAASVVIPAEQGQRLRPRGQQADGRPSGDLGRVVHEPEHRGGIALPVQAVSGLLVAGQDARLQVSGGVRRRPRRTPPAEGGPVLTQAGERVGLDRRKGRGGAVQAGQCVGTGGVDLTLQCQQVGHEIRRDLGRWAGAECVQVVRTRQLPVLHGALSVLQRHVEELTDRLTCETERAGAEACGGDLQKAAAFRGVLPCRAVAFP